MTLRFASLSRALLLAPHEITATRLVNGTEAGTALVCAYPQVPTYRGSGSSTSAASFACRAADR